MRKDVKIGSAIAGVLVVLLVVYAIIPHNKTNKSVAQNPDQVPAEVGATEAPPETETPSTTETPTAPVAKAKDPFGAPETPTPATKSNGVDVNHPADAPLATDTPANTETNWGQILNSGQLPKAEKGNGAPPLYTTSPANGSGAKAADSHSSTDAKSTDTGKTERPLYGSDSPSRPSGTPASENPPIVPSTPAKSSGSSERSHVIQKGETLSSISEMAYGSSKLYTLIQKANPDLDDRHLKVGASIKIPEHTETASSTATTSRKSNASTAGAPALAAVGKSSTPSSTPSNATTEYRVQAGDTLYGIAKKLYGNGSRMHKLHDLNKVALGNDPDSLKIGMILKLPEPPTNSTR